VCVWGEGGGVCVCVCVYAWVWVWVRVCVYMGVCVNLGEAHIRGGGLFYRRLLSCNLKLGQCKVRSVVFVFCTLLSRNAVPFFCTLLSRNAVRQL